MSTEQHWLTWGAFPLYSGLDAINERSIVCKANAPLLLCSPSHPALGLAPQSRVSLKLHPGDFWADRGNHAGEGTRLGPIKVSVNGPSGEDRTVKTRTNGFGPIKLPWRSCSGNAPLDVDTGLFTGLLRHCSLQYRWNYTSKHVFAPQEYFRWQGCGKVAGSENSQLLTQCEISSKSSTLKHIALTLLQQWLS